MADTTLSPTGLVQPEVGASDDSWGAKINDDLALLNTLLGGLATGSVAFSPVVTTSGTQPTGLTYSTQLGQYVKIGDVVVATLTVVLSNKGTGGTGQVRVSVPFAATARAGSTTAHNENTTGIASGSFVVGLISSGASFVEMRVQSANASTTLDWANVTNTWQAIFTIIYIAS